MDTAARWRSGIHTNASRLLGLSDRALPRVGAANGMYRLSFLPGTVNRVNMIVSHRKQMIAHPFTRNIPTHAFCPIPGEFANGLA